MSFNAKQFLEDYNIQYHTEGADCSPGYVNIQCPFCDDTGHHGGFNIEKGFYSCWRCGGHSLENVIRALLEIKYRQAEDIRNYYTSKVSVDDQAIKRKAPTRLRLPKEVNSPLPKKHRQYLRSRNFDPDRIETDFDLHGTGLLGNYKNRIIAPIYYNKKLVSYQGRDITNRHALRYKACKKSDEVIHHKYILYNIDNAKDRQAIVVEGITDVWRLGHGSVATFGTGWTNQQLNILVDRFDLIYIFYDDEAQDKADKLATVFSSFRNKEAIIVYDTDYEDPASMPQADADKMMSEMNF